MKKIKVKLDCEVNALDKDFMDWISYCLNDFNSWTISFSLVDEND